jgi:hypothetical protein
MLQLLSQLFIGDLKMSAVMCATPSMDIDAMVRQAKCNQLARDFGRFTSGVLNAIMKKVTGTTVRVYISRHFPERLIGRNYSEREDRLFLFKLLSYVCEHRSQELMKDVDTFVRYKDLMIMLVCHEKDGLRQVRLNTIFANGDDCFLNPKNGRKYKIVDVSIKEVMDYVPLTLQPGYVKEEKVERRW